MNISLSRRTPRTLRQIGSAERTRSQFIPAKRALIPLVIAAEHTHSQFVIRAERTLIHFVIPTEAKRSGGTCLSPSAPRRFKLAASLLLCIALAGCHKARVVAAPPPPPPVPTATVSVPPPTHPTEPEPAPEVVETPTIPTPPPTPPRRTPPPRRRPATPPATTATATPPPLDLGQLTTGGESNNAALRQSTEDLLRAQQRRLIALPSAISANHSEQVERARLFLRDADEAWKKLDIEGARNLATKAKILLDEITR